MRGHKGNKPVLCAHRAPPCTRPPATAPVWPVAAPLARPAPRGVCTLGRVELGGPGGGSRMSRNSHQEAEATWAGSQWSVPLCARPMGCSDFWTCSALRTMTAGAGSTPAEGEEARACRSAFAPPRTNQTRSREHVGLPLTCSQQLRNSRPSCPCSRRTPVSWPHRRAEPGMRAGERA